MNILLLTPDYPDDKRMNFAFVKQLADEMAVQGHTVQVVAPYSLSHNRRLYKRKEVTRIGGGVVIVYRPRYISFSNLHIGSFSFSSWSINYAFKKGLKMICEEPDVVYGHFWSSAYQGFHYARNHNLPLFAATGESEIVFSCNDADKKFFCNYLSGVICVSTKNKNESIRRSLTQEDKCFVVPNAVDSKLFKQLDKTECREKLHFPQEAFIVAYVGWFNERKGSERLSTAITMIERGGTVFSIFVGEGPLEPKCDNILFKGSLDHKMIPFYLNAADVFVLPTYNEGCCNAIVEAMACGLPVISSDLPFNYDVCDDSNSILINPADVVEIRNAIVKIRDDKSLLERLSIGALEKAKSLTIDKRVSTIIQLLNHY